MTDHDDFTPPPAGGGWRAPHRIDGPTSPTAARCHLVVGFDRHPASHAALSYALDLAARISAFVHVAHIVDTEDLPIDPDAADWEQAVTDTVELERRDACALLERAASPWAYYSRPGRPAQLLTGLADTYDAEMIIIGASRGGLVSLLERLLGESVSTSLGHHAHRPVLLVPAPTVDRKPDRV
ncbi:universal stress protein [Nocardia zapadnayensis]|uniref:universal stress protein n=1 Tax=Nocardia rhamnosiphila TaxID=426716 RepID=UPI00224875BD|nr:universal stress protein [Nocardia zapadnayensis]MCX0271568.1 universal stress protein [Nocardia zapadnayensis]